MYPLRKTTEYKQFTLLQTIATPIYVSDKYTVPAEYR